MELEGLKRCKAQLDSNNIKLEEITTDRHTQVDKYIGDNWDVNHTFDTWHISKSECMEAMLVR